MRTTPHMGLYSWDQLGDNYNYAQLAQNMQTMDYHDHSAGRGVQIPAGGLAPGAVLSSNIAANQVGAQHLSQSIAQNLGMNISGAVGQGYVSIPTSQSTTSTTYTYLATPDSVSNVVISTGGLIFVAYQAMWNSSVATASNVSAAVFLNTNQLQAIQSTTTTTPTVQAATNGAASTVAEPLASTFAGLIAGAQTSAYTGNVTTGQVLGTNATGGIITIFAAAGTYTVGVEFKAASGSVTVSNRQLWVWTRNFN